MKWTQIIEQKSKAVAALAVIFLMVFVTNRVDKERFTDLNESATALYKDRLVANNLLFKLSNLVHKRTQWVSGFSNMDDFKASQDVITSIIEQYETTDLTREEAIIFDTLKRKLRSLKSMDGYCLAKYPDQSNDLTKMILAQHELVLSEMESLAGIQLSEGKKLADGSHKIASASVITSQFEVAILIIIAMIAMSLVFESKSLVSRIQQNPHLN